MKKDTIPGREGGLLSTSQTEPVGFPAPPSGRARKRESPEVAVLSVAARMKAVEEFLGLKDGDDPDGEV